jgi:hypothetical protein
MFNDDIRPPRERMDSEMRHRLFVSQSANQKNGAGASGRAASRAAPRSAGGAPRSAGHGTSDGFHRLQARSQRRGSQTQFRPRVGPALLRKLSRRCGKHVFPSETMKTGVGSVEVKPETAQPEVRASWSRAKSMRFRQHPGTSGGCSTIRSEALRAAADLAQYLFAC